MLLYLLIASLFILFYIYLGYLLLLKSLFSLKHHLVGCYVHEHDQPMSLPAVSVVISIYNEESVITTRLENLLTQDYPLDKIEILVVSDGSSDHGVEKVKAFAAKNPGVDVRVLALPENHGKALALNHAIPQAKHDIIVLSDADSHFRPECLRVLVKPLASPDVAVVGGITGFKSLDSHISQDHQLYRSMEYRIREYEYHLKVMCIIDGYCAAFRRHIWEPLESFEITDLPITFFAKQKGYITAQAQGVICLESPNATLKQELVSRARMTRRVLFSFFYRWRRSDWLRFPGFTLAFLSHKFLRFLSPFFLILFLISGTWLLALQGLLSKFLWLGGCIGALAIIGHYWRGWTLPSRISGKLASFLIANAGFAWGVIGWLKGNREGRWTPTRKL